MIQSAERQQRYPLSPPSPALCSHELQAVPTLAPTWLTLLRCGLDASMDSEVLMLSRKVGSAGKWDSGDRLRDREYSQIGYE